MQIKNYFKGETIVRFISFVIVLFLTTTVIAQVDEQKMIKDIEVLRINNKLPKAADISNKLAMYYWENAKYEKALEMFQQSVTINKEIGNTNAIKAIYSNMGMIYSDMGQPETALVFFRKSLLISRQLNNKQDIGTNLINIAVSLNTLKRYDEAIENLKEAVGIFMETNNKKMLRTCYGYLYEYYDESGNTEESQKYFALYSTFQKHVQEEEVKQQKKIAQEKVAKMEKTAQKAIQDKQLTQKKLTVTRDSLKIAEELNELNRLKIQTQQAELRNQRLLNFIFIIGLGFVVIVALFVFRSYREKKKHNAALAKRNEEIKKRNEEIQAQNHKIGQSINYAKNIQGALLPPVDGITQLFPDSFIFFSPRDVVSGDFYWYSSVVKDGKTYKVVAAVDCTGHGVPGAFMSMLGNSFMNEIIIDKNIVSPDTILEEMHELVRSSLKQDSSGNNDGMDMAVCVVDESEKKLYFAGAINPLVYIQNSEINVIKGDIFGIGGQMKSSYEKKKDKKGMFTVKTIDISQPTVCYIFSDGYADQFGGKKGRKFFMKNFRNLLLDIHSKPAQEQKEILQQKIDDWMGGNYQRIDDILVIGFKV